MHQLVDQGLRAQVLDRHSQQRIQVFEWNALGVRGHQALQYPEIRLRGAPIVDAVEVPDQIQCHKAILVMSLPVMMSFSDLNTRAPGSDRQDAIDASEGVNRDAQPLRDLYFEDADWVNAYGTVRRGRNESSST